MKKLKLEIDRLKVESFSSSEVSAARGTVRGHNETETCVCTVIPHYCYPNSDVMDCQYDPSHNSCGCVVGP